MTIAITKGIKYSCLVESKNYKKQNSNKKKGSCKVLAILSLIGSIFVAALGCINEGGKSMPPHSYAAKTPLKAPHWIQ